MTIELPDKLTEEGAEVRVLLAECTTPAYATYTLADAKLAMQYMDAVLWNRTKNPRPYGAKSGATLIDVIKARGQFAGFEQYPSYSSAVILRIEQCLEIANSARDKRSAAYADFVNAALARARATELEDPSPGDLTAWRTAGRGSPGPGFTEFQTVLGNTFYWVPHAKPKP